MDSDTRFALTVAPIGGALGSAVERLVTYLEVLPATRPDQFVYLHDKELQFAIYVVVASVVTTAAVLLLPINRQNRAQLIGTAIVFGLIWPSLLDRLRSIAGVAIKQ
jgi:hypothetical protein